MRRHTVPVRGAATGDWPVSHGQSSFERRLNVLVLRDLSLQSRQGEQMFAGPCSRKTQLRAPTPLDDTHFAG